MKSWSAVGTGLLVVVLVAGGAGCASTGETTGEYLSDSWITTKVKSAFVADKQLSALHIKVDTMKGVVTLSGSAATKAEADHAAEVARGVKGVQSVSNNIQVKK
ncbi:MAG TPA: BON domain-containing protein [Burkholderiales bacterium]|nr:BON domain-containing protein [Burkholderiales bacterium]